MHKKKITLIVLSFVVAIVLLIYFVINTTKGSLFAIDKIISIYANNDDVKYKSFNGNLGQGLTYENLEIKNIKNLPAGTVLRIQKIYFNVEAFSFNGIHVEIENARLRLPDSDPIVFSGDFKEQNLNLNVFSRGFTVNEVLSYLPDFKLLIPIKGEVKEIDLTITEHYLNPVVKGSLVIDKFIYKGFQLTNVPLGIDMRIEDVKSDVKLFGNIAVEKGELQTKRVVVNLDSGSLKFSGPWNNPHVNINGRAKVEKTKITIAVKGTVEKPDLVLISDPPQNKQKLMIMLATGKSWQSLEDSANGELNSTNVTKDFIDYFFFAGKSNQFAKRFGISDFSLTLDGEKQGIAVKKEFSEKLEIGYGIEKTVDQNNQNKNVSQKLEGEYKISNEVSLGVEREITQKQLNDTLDEQTVESNDKVMIKYKKSF